MKLKSEKDQKKEEFPDRLYVRFEFRPFLYDRLRPAAYESEMDIGDGCMGIYQLMDVVTVRQVRTVEHGCKPPTPA